MQLSQVQEDRYTELRLEEIERAGKTSAVGLVCPDKGLTHALHKLGDKWIETDKPPTLYLAAKLERVLTSTKRFIHVIGGRGSSKSLGVGDICLLNAKDEGKKTYCLREFQSSIKNSVHSLLSSEIERLEMPGFEVLDQSIKHNGKDVFQFAGVARNVDSIKSAHDFGAYWVEEAQGLSQPSIEVLTPTARNKPNRGLPNAELEEIDIGSAQLYFVANPASSNDPYSKRFINPFKSDLDKYGFYEDDLHLIVVMNYTDNPWFKESGLEKERRFDFKTKARTTYNHIWMGGFNDHVDRAVIQPEWFDAAIDAHIKLGIKPKGATIASFDVADEGDDTKAYACRKGILYTEVTEIDVQYGNDACDVALEKAIAANADLFVYDGDGMGALLRKQVTEGLAGIKCDARMYKGSNTPDDPELFYDGLAGSGPKDKPKKNKDMFANKRAQFTIRLADKFQRTYLAVVKGEYQDPDTLISLSSEIEFIDKLRSELCRLPLKDHSAGKIQIMPKVEMKRVYKLESPGMADCVTMGGEVPEARTKAVKIQFVEGFG